MAKALSRTAEDLALRPRGRVPGRVAQTPGRFISGMITPAVLIIAFIVLFPLAYSFFLSFTSYTLLNPEPRWVGLDKYPSLFSDSLFWQAFLNTLIFLFVTVNVEFLLGLFLSQIIARTARGQSILRTLLMVPMMFAPVL